MIVVEMRNLRDGTCCLTTHDSFGGATSFVSSCLSRKKVDADLTYDIYTIPDETWKTAIGMIRGGDTDAVLL